MEITYLGHSCFRVKGREATVLTDPFTPKFGLGSLRSSAGIVTVSRRGGTDAEDHTYVVGVSGDPRVIDGPGEYEIAGVLINGIRTYKPRTSTDGPTTTLNTVYVIGIDDLRICHLGDLEDKLTPDQIEALGAVNVLMIPVGGGSTIGPNAAVEVVSQLEPNIVIPMHYRMEGTRSHELEPLDRFVREMGLKSVEPSPKLSLNSKTSPPSELQVVVMDPRKGA